MLTAMRRAMVVLGAASVLLMGNPALAGQDDAARRREEYYARLMVQWMRARRREPTQEDLNSNSYLRKLWDAYRRVEGRRQAEERGRQAERRRSLERRRRELEERASRQYQEGLDLFAARRYRDAIRKLKGIVNNSDYAAYHAPAIGKLEEIDQIGQAEINQAKQHAATQDYESAFTVYRGVIIRFSGAPCAQAAAKELAALKNSPQVQAKLKRDRAADILKRAEAALAEKQYTAAASLYEILVEAYGDLPEGQTAKAKLEALKADRDVWPLILKQRAEAEAKSLFAMANSYITMGMREKALPRLQELIQKYPDSDYARKAGELLGPTTTTRPAP